MTKPEPVRLPLAALRLLLCEHARINSGNPGYTKLPIEADDDEGFHWTVATRDSGFDNPSADGMYLVRETNPYRIAQAVTEGRKAGSEVSTRTTRIRAIESRRAEALSRFLSRYPADMPERPEFRFEEDDDLERLRTEVAEWQLRVDSWKAIEESKERQELRFPRNLHGISILLEV